MTGRHHPALEKLIGNFQHSSSVRTNLHGCRTFLDVLGRVKSSFLEVLDLADCACYDHASWADILSDCDPAALPPEVDAYLHRRPKAYLNFEEFDYGGASTAGFKAAGLAATNQVSPVDSDEYETANQTDGPAGGVADFSSVLHPDGTVVTAETVRHRLCLVSALPSWRRHRLCLVSALPPWLRHHILPFVCTAFVAKTPPLPCVCSAFVAKTSHFALCLHRLRGEDTAFALCLLCLRGEDTAFALCLHCLRGEVTACALYLLCLRG